MAEAHVRSSKRPKILSRVLEPGGRVTRWQRFLWRLGFTGYAHPSNALDLLELPGRMPECQGADFSRAAYALGQALMDHADRDGLTGVQRAVFMDRGGHAVGEACPTAPPEDPHLYWCNYPDDECNCPAGRFA